MISVILNYRTGAKRSILLSGVPRVGDHIRPKAADPETQSLIVEHVLWLESDNGDGEPSVIVSVAPRKMAS